MKSIYRVCALMFVLLLCSPLAAQEQTPLTSPAVPLSNQTGPDAFGYTFANSFEMGCTYTYTNVGMTQYGTIGTPLNLAADGVATVNLPFAFQLYDQTSSQIRVGNDGYILLGATGALSSINSALPAVLPAPALLPFWDDLGATATGNVYTASVGTAPNRRFIVQWQRLPHASTADPTKTGSFQVVLYERNFAIDFMYADTDFGDPAVNFGASATVGLNQNSTVALQYEYNRATPPAVPNQFGLCFRPPFPVPNPEGYFFVPGPQPGCKPTFTEISTTGTRLNLLDDDAATVQLPFDLSFYSSQSRLLRVGNNGGILFGVDVGAVAADNTALPVNSVAPTLLPFWDDLSTRKGNVYTQTLGIAPARRFVVEWFDRPHFPDVGAITFEVIFYENSTDIDFVYADVEFDDAQYNGGAAATIGINRDSTSAYLYSFNQAVLQNGSAVCLRSGYQLFLPVLFKQ